LEHARSTAVIGSSGAPQSLEAPMREGAAICPHQRPPITSVRH
jgi:hypothetical protein